MKRKILILGIIFIIGIILFLFLSKNNYNIFKFGNNISKKSADEIKEYILSMKSFEAEISVTVSSNKNTNTYTIKQQCYGTDKYRQEVIEPSNIKGLTTSYDGLTLKIENSNLNLSTIYENYKGIADNALWLNSFIEDYKTDTNSKCTEKENELVLETNSKSSNKYIVNKKLYINKSTAKPAKLEVRDITQNITIYILYNKIEMNNLRKR